MLGNKFSKRLHDSSDILIECCIVVWQIKRWSTNYTEDGWGYGNIMTGVFMWTGGAVMIVCTRQKDSHEAGKSTYIWGGFLQERICDIKRATAYVHRKQHSKYMPIRRCSRSAMRRMTTLYSLLQAAAVTNYLLLTMVHFRRRRVHTWTGMSDCLCWSFHNSTCVRFSARISQMGCMHQFTLGEYYQKGQTYILLHTLISIYLTVYTYKHISYCIHL